MKLHIDREALLAHLVNANGVVNKDAQDASRCVLLSATDGSLELFATDLLHSYSAGMEAKVDREGTVALPAEKLYQTVKAQSEHAVTLTWEPGKPSAELRAGGSKSRIAALPADEFPELPTFEPAATATLLEGDLHRLVSQVGPFVDPNDARYGLNGAHMVQAGNHLRLEGTDGNRLARVEALFEGEIGDLEGSLVSRKALSMLQRLLDRPEQHVSLAFDEGALQVERGDQVLWFRLIKGLFPDVEGIIPTEPPASTVTVSKPALVAALNRVLICNRDEGTATEVRVTENGLYLRGWNRSNGEVEEEVPGEVEGGTMRLGMEAKFIVDGARGCRGETVRLEFAGPLSPIVVRDEGALFVFGPRRLE